MDDLNTLWSKLLSDYARIKNKATKLSGGYQAFIDAAAALIRQCYGALSSLTDNEYTVDGGTPFTQIDVITELVTESGPIVSFDTKLHSSRPIEALIVDIDPIQSGTGDPSPTNIRPISGWNEVKVTRTWKNLLQCPTSGGRTNSGITWTYNSDGSVTASGTATGNSWSYGVPPATVTLPQGTYTASVTSPFGLVVQNLTDGGYFYNGGNSKVTFTIEKQTEVGVHARVGNGTTINATTGIQIEVGTEATEYEPYTGETYTVGVSSAGAVYGGTLDVTRGELTVDKKMVTIDGSESEWGATDNYNTIYFLKFTDLENKGIQDSVNIINNIGFTPCPYRYVIMDEKEYAVAIRANETSRWRIYLRTPNTTLDTLKSWLASHNLQVVYPLATPYTIQLTPQEIKTLLGNNNIWADAGDVTVTYPAKSDKDCNGGYPGS